MKKFGILIAACLLVAFADHPAFAVDFGIVMDVSGKVTANKKPLDLGSNVAVGDAVSVPEKCGLVIVDYASCAEWRATGPATLNVRESGIELAKGSAGKVEKGRKLPACFKPADLRTASTHEQGALVLMTNEQKNDAPTPPEPDAELAATSQGEPEGISRMRKDFKEGNADNSVLITLITYDLKNNDKDSARQYYAELMKRAPDSEFVRQIGQELN